MPSAEPLTGLFFGAGASYELGMPLASELTRELTKWLTADKLRELNASWRRRGGGYADAVIDDFVPVLSRSDQNYESLLGYLEVQFRRDSHTAHDSHALYSWLVQIVYYLLYFRHLNNADYIPRQAPNFAGLGTFVDRNRPLWVFSLNHDVLVECLALTNELPLSAGFTKELIHLPRRKNKGAPLKAEVLPEANIRSLGMPFLPKGTRGINLLKVHGGLDVFTFRDGKDLLRILPLEETVAGVVDSLRAVNEEIWHPEVSDVRPLNEIAYADAAGEMQFLRRSLLAGAFKFDRRHDQVLPHQLLGHFRTHLNSVRTLVCIGYSFGDDHVNRIVRQWLELGRDRKLVVVRPSVDKVPAPFLHVSPQVQLIALSATDYLDCYAGIRRSGAERSRKKVTSYFRRFGEDATREFVLFVREHNLAKLEEWLDRYRQSDGTLNTNALAQSPDALQEEVRKLMPSTSALLEEFVKARAR